MSNHIKTSYHEAGHAVVAWACGIEVLSVDAIDQESRFGRVKTIGPLAGDFTGLRYHGIVALAGMAAEIACIYMNKLPKNTEIIPAFSDIDQAQQNLSIKDHDKLWKHIVSLGVQLRSDTHWNVIRSVAEDLQLNGFLKSEKITYFSKITPPLGEIFWERFDFIQSNSGLQFT